MKARPLVSIGVPAFKGLHFKSALECWVRQSYKNFEVFVQDDASPDDLYGIFKEVCGDDPRFHFERNTKNTSPYFVENWMKTLDKANGEFFVLGSDDDLYEPEYLEGMVALAEKYPSVNLFDAYHDIFDSRGIINIAPKSPEIESQLDWMYGLVYAPRHIVAQSVMCRTSALRSIGGFPNLPAAWGACDWLTWCRLAENGVVNSNRVLMHWRKDGGNTTSSVSYFWLKQKLDALRQAQPLWAELVRGLKGTTPSDVFRIKAIRRRIVDNYIDWLSIQTYAQLPLRMFIRIMVAHYRKGEMSWHRLARYMVKRVMGVPL